MLNLPNLEAVLNGTVSGRYSEWPLVRAELAQLMQAFLIARRALAVYADEKNWQCPRCHGSDSCNCFMGLWKGPTNADPDAYKDGHGYDVARNAIGKIVIGEAEC